MTRTEAIARAIYQYTWDTNPSRTETMYEGYDNLQTYVNANGDTVFPKDTMVMLAQVCEKTIEGWPGAEYNDMLESVAGNFHDNYYPLDPIFYNTNPNVWNQVVDEVESQAALVKLYEDFARRGALDKCSFADVLKKASLDGIYKYNGFLPYDYAPDDIKNHFKGMAKVAIETYQNHLSGDSIKTNKREMKVIH